MQTDPNTVFLLVNRRLTDWRIEADAARLADVAVGRGAVRYGGLGSWLSNTARAAAELRPAFRRRSAAVRIPA
jgi:hypothetical protein